MFGGEYLKIGEANFPQIPDFGRRPLPLRACTIWSKSVEFFLHTVSAPWEKCLGLGPQKEGEIRKSGGTLRLRVGQSNLPCAKVWSIRAGHRLFLGVNPKFQKFAPPPMGGGGAWDRASPLLLAPARSPESFMRLAHIAPEILRFEKFRVLPYSRPKPIRVRARCASGNN